MGGGEGEERKERRKDSGGIRASEAGDEKGESVWSRGGGREEERNGEGTRARASDSVPPGES